MIKFICKDLWQVVFRKQIDNLKTNHRGTFVLTDNKFLALGRMSVDRGRGSRGLEEALGGAQAVSFLDFFLCGREGEGWGCCLLDCSRIAVLTCSYTSGLNITD
jgi:hypothetical protein